jgi:hypothetical protein
MKAWNTLLSKIKLFLVWRSFRAQDFYSLGQYRTCHINIFNYKPIGRGQKYFFSTDLNSTTQNYPKTTYLKILLIYTYPSPILQIQSPELAYRVTWCFFFLSRFLSNPKITLEWCIERLSYLIPDEVKIHHFLGPLLAFCWPPLVKILKRPIFSRFLIKCRTFLWNFSSVWPASNIIFYLKS